MIHLDASQVRKDFPILNDDTRTKPLSYLDSAATSQKPAVVLNAMHDYYTHANANVHRGVHELGDAATSRFEHARHRVARFLNADSRGLIFVRNTTEALNLVATGIARQGGLSSTDRVVLSVLEHHSNIVPWQLERSTHGFSIAAIPLHPDGSLDMDAAKVLLSPPTKLLSITFQSNVLGIVTPLKELIAMAHEAGILVVVDGAQRVPHARIDLQDLNCDFFAMSGHKMYGPMGSGVLWGKPELLSSMSPFLGGGSMIDTVTFERTTWAELPQKFEAGTPDVAAAVGLAAACDYVDSLSYEAIQVHETDLMKRLVQMLDTLPYIDVYGPDDRGKIAGAVSFNVRGVHAHDVGTICDRHGVAIRVGHHCCQPLMKHLGVPATARASVAAYVTHEDIDRLHEALEDVATIFARAISTHTPPSPMKEHRHA